MSSVIKVTNSPRVIQGVAFSFSDISGKANQYLEEVGVQAAKIIADAQKDAQQIRKKAEEDGRAAALKAVEKVLDEKVAKRMETLLPALQKVIEDLKHARQEWLNHWETLAVHTSAAMAARIVRRQLPQMPEVSLRLVREALELAAGSPELRIHLNPVDHETLKGQIPQLVRECARSAQAEVIADPQVTLGGCRIETRHGVIDQQFEAQLKRIEEELA